MNHARNEIEDLSTAEVAAAVTSTYSEGAQVKKAELCCPISYDPAMLEVIPPEILERDYGCGDPSQHLREGETVLDLGSGGGKICFIASQVVGPTGRVIGVDMTPDMLALARRWREEVGRRIGWQNVTFLHGRIEDLGLDLDRFGDWLGAHPVEDLQGWLAAEAEADRLRSEEPLVAEGSVDVVVSNCVLNLVANEAKQRLFGEIYRVLRRGGRAVISDIVSDREVPGELRADPQLWAGCVSGAFEEYSFLRAFERAGFTGVELASRQEEPWQVVDGIEFRSVTVVAWKDEVGEKPAPGGCC
ncbi:MAG: methyltransferase domain-containing protein [Planctomycetota bacterium]|jgi:SAM-dependent methyltransferase|nr:methyltransferase domain-containing protein [Planctomycetota bacterium]MDP6763001.1 methyltransferase domain-containing protein [Planctomycetota bacterium]MDP6990716.1 methyltransferase domain-containing protein [Planctomycetota bacterium]